MSSIQIETSASLTRADVTARVNDARRKQNIACADLRGADLPNVELSHADLRDADMRGAKLRGADVEQARLDYACLDHADLSGAHLLEVVFEGAVMTETRFSNTFLQSVDLTIDQREQARLD